MANWFITLNEKIIKQFSLEIGEKVTIGRGQEADIILDNNAISRLHVAVESTPQTFLVYDLGSKNGTFIDGKKIDDIEPVSDSSLIVFGKFCLTQAIQSDNDFNVTDSTSASIMDPDEETLFVGGAHKTTEKTNKLSLAKGQTRLTLVTGSASPKDLIIDNKNSVKIGKDTSCDIVIPGFFVAKAQCYIFKRDNEYFIVPQSSWVGTFVNDLKIIEERKLMPGDVIKIRNTSIRYMRSVSNKKHQTP